ncbi:hypothetical protein [Desulfopila aestuarii]|nr:hypothetical protein [Desulfopila aestuarii]
MKTRRYFSLLALVSIGFLMLASGVLASGGRGGSGGGGGNGGDGGDGGSTKDLGDLIILYRDAYGVPIASDPIMKDDEQDVIIGGKCWQPIAFPSDTCDLESLIDSGEVECIENGPCLVPVDQYSCAVETAYVGCTKEVDFGRTNEARSPDDVFQSQLEDVIVNLATADCVTLDPAGRLVTSRVADGGTATTNAIDSPLQNLAIYREIILKGSLGAPLPQGIDIYDTAARALGAASDKSGGVDVDQVAYLNQIMGLSDPETPTAFGKICEKYREEVQGKMEPVDKCFLNYGPSFNNVNYAYVTGANYFYSRTTNFDSLPSPAYIPAGDPQDGYFEYLAELDDPQTITFVIMDGPILGAVFNYEGGSWDNIGGFAQAADDTRAVIEFMHLYPVLPNFATPLVCAASGDINYDVSISDVSGLQVPQNIVNGSEGREFTVTVANAGPDAASGTVMVTASYGNDPITDSPWNFTFTSLPPGVSESFVQFFTVNIVDIVPEMTITWTGTVITTEDVNGSNNFVEETSKLIVTGGGKR